MSAATHQDDSGDRLAPFNPTHETAIDIAIQLLGLSKNDILFDLGCGDGRFLIQAAKSISGLTCEWKIVSMKTRRQGIHKRLTNITSTYTLLKFLLLQALDLRLMKRL